MENIIVNTGGTMENLQKGWIGVDVSTASISATGYSQEVIAVGFTGSCNFNTFSAGGFSEFETKIVSIAGLVSNTWLPQNKYSFDYARVPNTTMESNAITLVEKVALSILLNCRNAGYHITARVSGSQGAYINLLNFYNIPIW